MSDKKAKLGHSISINAKEKLIDIAKKLKLSQSETIEFLIENYDKYINRESVLSLQCFNLSGKEQVEVENALINSDSQLDEVARDGLLQRSRYLNSIADKQSELESMSDEEMKKATFKGAAKFKIEQAIEMIMNHNDSQPEKENKVCLTRGIVFKLTGSNRQTINKYFNDYDVMISDHNHKHSLTDSDNRKGKGFSFEELLGV